MAESLMKSELVLYQTNVHSKDTFWQVVDISVEL